MMKRLGTTVFAGSLIVTAMAQGFSKTEVIVALTSEGQYNMSDDKTNWVNLLEVDIETSLHRNLTLKADMITTQNTRLQRDKEGICNDLQVFSNIEEENHELTLFFFGPTWKATENLALFLGVRNVNFDYFNSPMTSVFTGSSQGIYPVISENWQTVANYPISAMCLHTEWEIAKRWSIRNSFYNGVASHRIADVFRFRPHRDGIFNITQLGYTASGNTHGSGEYYAGFAYGNAPNEEGKKDDQTTVFGLIEQPLMKDRVGLLLEGGWAPSSQTCHSYFGAGVVCTNILKEDASLGIMANRALYEIGRETDIEFTYILPVTQHIAIQPSLHVIRTSGTSNTVGLLRVNICL